MLPSKAKYNEKVTTLICMHKMIPNEAKYKINKFHGRFPLRNIILGFRPTLLLGVVDKIQIEY